MSNERHRGGPPQVKPPASPAISVADARALIKRVEDLEKLVKEHFDEKNQWNSLVREWFGKQVRIQLTQGGFVEGILRWVDRYTLCVDTLHEGTCVVHKGAVAVIRLSTQR